MIKDLEACDVGKTHDVVAEFFDVGRRDSCEDELLDVGVDNSARFELGKGIFVSLGNFCAGAAKIGWIPGLAGMVGAVRAPVSVM